MIDDIISEDTKNILSSTTVENENGLLITIQQQPSSTKTTDEICKSIYYRLQSKVPDNILETKKVTTLVTEEQTLKTEISKLEDEINTLNAETTTLNNNLPTYKTTLENAKTTLTNKQEELKTCVFKKP